MHKNSLIERCVCLPINWKIWGIDILDKHLESLL